MELLTGRAKQAFIKWLQEQDVAPHPSMFDSIPLIVQTSYITTWIDGVGIMAETEYLEHLTQYTGKAKDVNHKLREDIGLFKNRSEALQAAIAKANDIYNAKH